MLTANLVFVPLAAPAVLLALVFVALHGWTSLRGGLGLLGEWWVLLPVLTAGVVVHELIHGLTWAWYGGRSLRGIQFGFQLRTLTPFARVKAPINVWAYRIGTAMPGLVLGVLPSLLGALLDIPVLTAVGLLLTLVAGGDLLVLWLIRDVAGDRLVLDHPTRAGCHVLPASAALGQG